MKNSDPMMIIGPTVDWLFCVLIKRFYVSIESEAQG